MRAARETHHERDVGQLVVAVHVVLAGKTVFAQQMAVIGGENDQGVIVVSGFLELVDQATEPFVSHGQRGAIAVLEMFDGLFGFGHGAIGRAIETRPVVVVAIEIQIFLRRIERLMRIEHLDLQEVIVLILVVFDPVTGSSEGALRGVVLFFLEQGTVGFVLIEDDAVVLQIPVTDRRDPRNPGIVFLATHVVPGIEFLQIVFAAGFGVVAMVGDDVAEHPLVAQRPGDGLVKRLDRPPAPFEEIQPTGQEIPPRRHAGGRADEMIVENERFLCKLADVRRNRGRLFVIGFEIVSVQAVHQDQDRFHVFSFEKQGLLFGKCVFALFIDGR